MLKRKLLDRNNRYSTDLQIENSELKPKQTSTCRGPVANGKLFSKNSLLHYFIICSHFFLNIYNDYIICILLKICLRI